MSKHRVYIYYYVIIITWPSLLFTRELHKNRRKSFEYNNTLFSLLSSPLLLLFLSLIICTNSSRIVSKIALLFTLSYKIIITIIIKFYLYFFVVNNYFTILPYECKFVFQVKLRITLNRINKII